jgi:peptidoglycan hydrolase-like protein with peptidoglycan-binding domain
MDLRFCLLLTTLLMSSAALAQQEQSQAQPQQAEQQAQPQQAEQQAQQPAADPYVERNKRVQEMLRQRGFYNGPVNGDIGPNTQAAIAQFQLSLPMPVSGMLDETTLAALGVEEPASTGPTAQAASEPANQNQNESHSQNRPLGGSCDSLIGPEKDRCLQQGGTVEASTNATASTGGSAPTTEKGN